MGKKWIVRKNQQGFTLVNVAGLIVSAGLAMGVAVQAPAIVENVQFSNFYDDLKNIENQVWNHRDRVGRWPGDCDKDGVIGFIPVPGVEVPNKPGTIVSDKIMNEGACTGKVVAETVDAPFSDIRAAGLVDKDIPNSILAKHTQGSYFQIGHTTYANGPVNVIVAYGVPSDVAQMIDTEIDGSANGEAGRVRRWDSQDSDALWTSKSETVALAYYFDKTI